MVVMARRTRKLVCTVLLLLTLLCFQLHSARAHGGIDHGDGDEDEDHEGAPAVDRSVLRSKGLIAVKVWCLVILLVGTFLGGVSPYFYRWNEAFLLLGTQFAAGIFLGTALMHFPRRLYRDLSWPHQEPIPILLHACLRRVPPHHAQRRRHRRRGQARPEEEPGRPRGPQEEGVDASSSGATATHGQQHPMLMTATSSFEDAILLIVALCFHSIFEGIAIGVSATKDEAWRNLWTIGLHKIFAAVAMGIALLRMIPKRPFLMTVVYSLAFAVSSPLGVGIGIAIDATAEGLVADWTYAISMGIATGVFVYVAINHLMAKGYRPQHPNYFDKPIFKFLGALSGVAVMAVVMIWD
ncbi:hypothetical protein ACQ4PT_068900 [Festuca glaucescens]